MIYSLTFVNNFSLTNYNVTIIFIEILLNIINILQMYIYLLLEYYRNFPVETLKVVATCKDKYRNQYCSFVSSISYRSSVLFAYKSNYSSVVKSVPYVIRSLVFHISFISLLNTGSWIWLSLIPFKLASG